MPTTHLPASIGDLLLSALASMAASAGGVAAFVPAIAHFDPRKDQVVVDQPAYGAALASIAATEPVPQYYGAAEAPRLILQLVYLAARQVAAGVGAPQAVNRSWDAFIAELARPHWSYKAVANFQNLTCSEYPVDLVEGATVLGRSFEQLEAQLGWGQFELDQLQADWALGASSSFVLLLEKEVAKTPRNLLASSDGTAPSLAARVLLAMRLAAEGDVRVGRLFYARPAEFNVGLGGSASSGFTVWHPGRTFHLTPQLVPSIRRYMALLSALEAQATKGARTLRLALRSFSAIYDRLSHQAEDRIVDAVTALEALWRLDSELSFRLAFRTASLLGQSDDERATLLDALTDYYRIRSKVVHGGALSSTDEQKLINDEPLRDIVRRALAAFLQLAIHPGAWTIDRAVAEADRVLLQVALRRELQAEMGVAWQAAV